MRTPVSVLIGRCQICGTDGSVAQMNSVWRDRKEIRYHSVCGICSHLFDHKSLKPHPFRQSSVSSLATTGWWINRVQWSPEGGVDGRGRFLRPAEAADRVRQMRGVAHLSPDVTEEQLAPRRALLRGDGLSVPVLTLALNEQYELEGERAEEEERRRRQAVRAKRRALAATEPKAEPPAIAAVVVAEPLDPAGAVARRVSLAPEVEEAPIEVEAPMVEEVPATVTAVAEDPNVVEARKRVARLQGTAAWERLTGEQQNEVGALLATDAVAAAERLAAYIAAAVERPKPTVKTCASRDCNQPVWDQKGPFRNAHGLDDVRLEWADGKFFCFGCRGQLILRVRQLLAQRAEAAPPLERREPLAGTVSVAEERVAPPVVATATA